MSHNIRYSFKWQVLPNGDCHAIVTRDEWAVGSPFTGHSTCVNKVKIEVTDTCIRMCPVPPAKTFYPFPKEEKDKVKEVARSYHRAVNNQSEFTYWEKSHGGDNGK